MEKISFAQMLFLHAVMIFTLFEIIGGQRINVAVMSSHLMLVNDASVPGVNVGGVFVVKMCQFLQKACHAW